MAYNERIGKPVQATIVVDRPWLEGKKIAACDEQNRSFRWRLLTAASAGGYWMQPVRAGVVET
jgi:hypothetical protein